MTTRNALKLIKYQGVIFDKVSAPEYLNDKKDAVKVVCVRKNETTGKFEKELNKIMVFAHCVDPQC